MAWTLIEIDAVRAAMMALATGTRIASVSYAGPPQRSVTYGVADIAMLRTLLLEMERGIVVAGPRFRRVSFSKGFDAPRCCPWRCNCGYC